MIGCLSGKVAANRGSVGLDGWQLALRWLDRRLRDGAVAVTNPYRDANCPYSFKIGGSMADEDPVFGDVIYSYTRKQAIEDGVLVDITEMAKEIGRAHV